MSYCVLLGVDYAISSILQYLADPHRERSELTMLRVRGSVHATRKLKIQYLRMP
jgi:hypothetical protein